ncbi:MAG: hypothetical protein MJ094_07930 [Saccharofermentans sp.]|nr:hypothetical protein [Saccharofermentans sp.]
MSKLNSSLVNKIISWLMIVILAIIGLVTIKNADGIGIPGDGFEYLMMQISFQNHGSFDVTESDVEDAKQYFDNEIFDTIYRDRAETTLIEGNNGKLYAKHFGMYSVIGLPLSRVFHYFGINPAKAFMVMNLVFWLFALVVVRLFLKTDEWRKTLLIAFLTFNPIYFYLSWVHTELFIFAFVIIGLVFWNNRKFIPAMLFTSIAATCNLAVLTLAFVIGLDFVISTYLNTRNIGNVVKKAIPLLACALPGFIPVILSIIHFGTYSPVASVASVGSSEFPADSRLWAALSYIIDPNQGMLVYSALIVPTFIVLIVINLFLRERVLSTVLNLSAVLLMLVIISQELHINCGMSFIMRYNVWMLPIYAFFVVYNLRKIWQGIAIVGGSTLWALAIILVMFTSGLTNCYLSFTPIGEFVLNRFPTLYNPPVGIFYSRTLGLESYYCKDPVAYRDRDGNVLKILMSGDAIDSLNNGEWVLLNGEYPSASTVCGPHFIYFNYSEEGVRLVPNTNILDFSNMSETDTSYILSEVGIEGDNLLMYGNTLHIRNYMMPGVYNGSLGISNVFGGVQNITISINGSTVYTGPVSMEDDRISFDFEVDETCVCDMEIDAPSALSPSSVDPNSNDDRVLSLYLTDFVYEN